MFFASTYEKRNAVALTEKIQKLGGDNHESLQHHNKKKIVTINFPVDWQNNNQYFVITGNKTQEATVEPENTTIEQISRFNTKMKNKEAET